MTDSTPRTPDRIRAHYLIEKALADRLRHADRDERRHLYSDLYDELFQRVPDHSQLHKKVQLDAAQRYWRELKLLRKILRPGASFMEVGAGDCQMALEVATWAGQVWAVDVSTEIVKDLDPPANFQLLLADGCRIPVAPASIDVAYSNQLIEHMHPDDAREHLSEVYAALRPGGVYVCLTPHRYTGPHDISRGFDAVATGFHLHEYTARELCALMHACGFDHTRQLIGARGRYLHVRPGLLTVVETLLGGVPPRLRRTLARLPALRMAFDRLMVCGHKPA